MASQFQLFAWNGNKQHTNTVDQNQTIGYITGVESAVTLHLGTSAVVKSDRKHVSRCQSCLSPEDGDRNQLVSQVFSTVSVCGSHSLDAARAECTAPASCTRTVSLPPATGMLVVNFWGQCPVHSGNDTNIVRLNSVVSAQPTSW